MGHGPQALLEGSTQVVLTEVLAADLPDVLLSGADADLAGDFAAVFAEALAAGLLATEGADGVTAGFALTTVDLGAAGLAADLAAGLAGEARVALDAPTLVGALACATASGGVSA